MSPATQAAPPSLAGATILLIVPTLRDDFVGHSTMDIARTVLQSGARARQFAESMFSPQSVAEAIRGVYTSLLARDT